MKTAKYLAAAERTSAKIEAYKQAKAAEQQAWKMFYATPVPKSTSSTQLWDEFNANYEAWKQAEKKKNIIGGFVKQMVSRVRFLRFCEKGEKIIYIKRDYIIPEDAIREFNFITSI